MDAPGEGNPVPAERVVVNDVEDSSTDSEQASEPDDVEEIEDEEFEDARNLLTMRDVHIAALRGVQDRINNDETFMRMSVGGLNVRMAALQDHFHNVTQAHVLYRQANREANDRAYQDIQEDYMSALDKIQTRIDELQYVPPTQPAARATQLMNSTMFGAGEPVIRVEAPRRPQVGKFDGNPESWPGFKDMFLSEVHNKPFDAVMKFVYLRDACTGAAARTLGTWQVTADNYQSAWECMLHAYDNDYEIVHGILNSMDKIEMVDGERKEDLQELLNTLNSSIRMLRSATTPKVLEDQLWIHYAQSHLSTSILDAWEQYRTQQTTDGLPTLEQFKQFLYHKTRVHVNTPKTATAAVAKPAAAGKGDHKSRDQSAKTTVGSQRNKPYDRKSNQDSGQKEQFGFGPAPACIMTGCDLVHYLGQCPNFKQLTLADKWEIVKEHQLCRCCLMAGHQTAQCKKRGCSDCPEAKFKHHFHLCSKGKGDSTKKESAKTAPSKK